MSDILTDDLLEYVEQDPVVEDPEELKQDHVLDVEKFDSNNFKDELILDEGLNNELLKNDAATDVVLSRAINNSNSSSQSINIENFDQVDLWQNTDPNSNYIGGNVILSDSISNYDFIGFEYKNSINLKLINLTLVKSNTLELLYGNPGNRIGLSCVNGGYWYNRGVRYENDNTLVFSSCYSYPSYSGVDNYCIPLKIYGFKANTLSNNDIPNQIVSGNNIYNFNYYCGVSENTVSNNLLNKPLSEFNIGESLGAYSMIFALGVSFYLLVRRCIFKWR